jgi:TetR/AcrR family transcriptional regulator
MVADAMSDEATSRREQRRQRHQSLSRSQLLDAAEEVFGRKGFHETTLKEIAELAEFSVGSVYSFFENKDDLFQQIFVRRGDEFMPLLREAARDEGTPIEQLHRLIDFEIGWFRANPHFGRLFLRHSSATMLSTDRDVDEVIATNYDDAMRLQAALIMRGQESGHFRQGQPEVLARLFSGMISAYQALDPKVVEDPPDSSVAHTFPLEQLHEVIDAAFVISPRRRGSR